MDFRLHPAAHGRWPLRSLLVDGIWPAGRVLVFLPQILDAVLFILALEDSGYRRAPLSCWTGDGHGGPVGALVHSVAVELCLRVPGVMATRSITHWRDRLVTIMIAPLMTCSARLPVYALLIAAFIPERTVAGLFNLQGLVLFALYVGALPVPWRWQAWPAGPVDQRPRRC